MAKLSHGRPTREATPAPQRPKLAEATPASGGSIRLSAPSMIVQRAMASPDPLRPDELISMQRTLGNRATGAILARLPIQAKLIVDAGDQYEREADRVADAVMRVPAMRREEPPPMQQDSPLVTTTPDLEHASAGNFPASEDFARRLQATQGRGRPLPPSLRETFETRFGADFSAVRIHSGAQAAELNHEIQALAFTRGSDIFWGAGKDHTSPTASQWLLAHELTHVVQQGAAAPQQVTQPGTDATAQTAPQRSFPAVSQVPQVVIQRVKRIRSGAGGVSLYDESDRAREEIPTWLTSEDAIGAVEVVEGPDDGLCKVTYNGTTYWLKLTSADEVFDDGVLAQPAFSVDLSDLDDRIAGKIPLEVSSASGPQIPSWAPSINEAHTGILLQSFPTALQVDDKVITLPVGTFSVIQQVEGQTVTIRVLQIPASAKADPSPDARSMSREEAREWVAQHKHEQAIDERMASHEGLVLDVPLRIFQAEPGFEVAGDQATGAGPGKDLEYREVRGQAFNGAPKSSDVNQGLLGDCPYLAVLVSLANTQPGRDLLTAMIQETNSGYSVTFPGTDKQKSTVLNLSRWFVVRRYLQKMYFAFARYAQDLEDKGTHLEINLPLWPMIIEKALAMHPAANDMQRQLSGPIGYRGLELEEREHTIFGNKTLRLDPSRDDLNDCRQLITDGLAQDCIVTIGNNAGMSGATTIYSADLCQSVTRSGKSIQATLKNLPWVIWGRDIRILFHKSVFEVDGSGNIVPEGPRTTPISTDLGAVNLETGAVNFTPPQAEGLEEISDQAFRVCLNLKMHYRHAFAIVAVSDDRVTILNPHGQNHLYLEISELGKYFNELEVSKVARLEKG